jgi:hypothetical protein
MTDVLVLQSGPVRAIAKEIRVKLRLRRAGG